MQENPTQYKYYPAISGIIKADELPDFLSFIKGGIQSVFDKIYYKNYYVSKSVSGSSAFYSLEIIPCTKLSWEIPGTGIFLTLNSDYHYVTDNIMDYEDDSHVEKRSLFDWQGCIIKKHQLTNDK